MSRLEEQIEIANPQQPHCAVVLLLDTSGSMTGDKIRLLNEGFKMFRMDIVGDEEKGVEGDQLAAKRVDLAVITFGGSVNLIHDFSAVGDLELTEFAADGGTPMAEAILRAIEAIEHRKQGYKSKGIDYYRPWIFMITDGDPTDMQPGDTKWSDVMKKVHDGEVNKKFMFFAVAVEPANTDVLSQIAPPNRPPVRLKGNRFGPMFKWLSNSLGEGGVSGSKVGDQVKLENPVAAGWAEVPTD